MIWLCKLRRSFPQNQRAVSIVWEQTVSPDALSFETDSLVYDLAGLERSPRKVFRFDAEALESSGL
jgi:hypothetical protein